MKVRAGAENRIYKMRCGVIVEDHLYCLNLGSICLRFIIAKLNAISWHVVFGFEDVAEVASVGSRGREDEEGSG